VNDIEKKKERKTIATIITQETCTDGHIQQSMQ